MMTARGRMRRCTSSRQRRENSWTITGRNHEAMIASRTPEGDPNRCPVCGKDCRLEPSLPARDGPCPHCGHLLWFGEAPGSEASDMKSVVLHILQARFGPLPPELEPALTAL